MPFILNIDCVPVHHYLERDVSILPHPIERMFVYSNIAARHWNTRVLIAINVKHTTSQPGEYTMIGHVRFRMVCGPSACVLGAMEYFRQHRDSDWWRFPFWCV